jgi:hypothetical protein
MWDDKMTIILNGGGKPLEIDYILLDGVIQDGQGNCRTAPGPHSGYGIQSS